MSTMLTRIATAAAALTLTAVLAPPQTALAAPTAPADPATPPPSLVEASSLAAGPLKLVFGSLQADDLEESGEDEVRVELKEPDGSHYYIWPTNGDEADTKVRTCWVWTSDASDCSAGSTRRAAGPYVHLTGHPGATFTIEVWEDDHIGDDLLLRIPVTIGSGEGTQYINATSPGGKGFSYRLAARIEPA
ncbi:hypothetical protein [Streptosporangium minutum]|uniref:Secreted protein n=1 Tax=Streptosporangium minutum TaxID=569862 RepID=A0A243RKH2_9ACTN|nr:hypothetical protein [Streptosporangium minutum]OUC95375.1 hypothetical protein CA984_18855 [Streptosporangium minutum]